MSNISIIIASVALLTAIGSVFFTKILSNKISRNADTFNSRPLQLQAYERLVVFAERIGIPNLISRVSQPGLNVAQMQHLLIESVKQEFEYNTSQQIYVSKNAWDVVKQLKDQNMLMIYQVAATLSPDSAGNELNKQLLEFIMSNNKAGLHEIVMEALNYEAKKIMK